MIGVEPAGAPKMTRSLAAGHPVTIDLMGSIADGLLAVRPGDVTFAHVQSLIDEVVTVTDDEIEAAVRNAKAFLAVQSEFGSFDTYVWQSMGGRPRTNAWRSLEEIPARTPESDAMSRDLKRRGFSFVGSTICYAFMQAVGMVNDHVVDCFRHAQVGGGLDA